jgi:lysophospholipase L1-like esterase|tara:strand:- start:2953 stop:4095 length:1143 start_codon:yes stop_codon:yes gene_type:complete
MMGSIVGEWCRSFSAWPLVVAAVGTVGIAGCSGSKSPAAPSALPPAAAIARLLYPLTVEAESLDGAPVEVAYSEPTVDTNGTPVNAVCQPKPGAMFAVGTTSVTCVRPESVGSRCSFSVVLDEPAPPPPPPPTGPMLGVTRIMAFGDSITKGTLSAAFSGSHGLTAYPTQLQAMLRLKYPGQEIEIINEGKAGENTRSGVLRIQSRLDQHDPELVLLLEGINNLRPQPEGAAITIFPDEAGDDLKRMSRAVLDSGADLILSTILPVTQAQEDKRPGKQQSINQLNTEIRRLAASLDVPLVDMFTPFKQDQSLLGSDGRHPTIEGYGVMAEVWRRIIVRLFDIPIEDLPDTQQAAGEKDVQHYAEDSDATATLPTILPWRR